MEMEIKVKGWSTILNPILDLHGGILYSSYDTLSKSDCYLLGVNPGGSGGITIREDISRLPMKQRNDYLDDCWENKAARYGKGKAPLQRRIRWLFEQLGYDFRKICASNLVFVKSEKVSDIPFFVLADTCWPIHQQIIEILEPKIIITFGNSDTSPYAYLKKKMLNVIENKPIKSGHGNWLCKSFRADFNYRQICVAGLPHMSRFSPIGRDHVIKWLKTML